MKIDILTLFPDICRAPLGESIMKRAQENGIVDLRIHNLRDWTTDKHHIVDDAPFGGGQGMVMKPEPIFAAVEDLQNQASIVVLMSPAGHRFDQQMATQLSQEPHVIILCGHYEGVDHRIAAVVLVDSIVRLLPGALGHEQSAVDDSFNHGLLEAAQYTRPADFRDWKVPEVLLSGNHAEIAKWRKEQALKRTRENRPDLLG